MILHYVTAGFTSNGLVCNSKPLEVIETNKSYVTAGFRLNKTRIMQPDTKIYEFMFNQIRYYTYCLDHQLEEAKAMLKKKILDTFEARIPVMDAMRRHFDMNRANTPESIVNNAPETHSMNVL